MQAYRDLTIRQFAQRPAVLTLHADRVLAFLGETPVIQDPEGFSLLGADSSRQLLPDRFPRPGALADKLLQSLFLALRQARDHGAHSFPFPIEQQASYVDLPPVATVLTAERSQHLLQVGFQAGTRGF